MRLFHIWNTVYAKLIEHKNDLKMSKNKICLSILSYQNTAFFLGLRYGSLFQNIFQRYARAWKPVLTVDKESSQIENDFPYVPNKKFPL